MSDLTALVERLQRQQAAIVRLARRQAKVADLTEALSLAVIEAAETLHVERVGVWVLTDDRRRLCCVRNYLQSSRTLGGGDVLRAEDYPDYFAALEAGRGIDAHDAREDPRTREFRDGYLIPLGITSMLDAAIRDEGHIAGVVCHEHVGSPRTWTADEVAFAGACADQVAMAFAAAERHRLAAEREQMQRHLLHAQKLESLGVLAGGIAHDFNNLLVGILTNAQFAGNSVEPGHPAHAAIDDVVCAAKRAAGLTRQLLAYSGRAPAVSRPTQLVGHVREITHLLESSISKDVRLHLDLPDDLPAVDTDVAQFQQVIMNVILNGAESIGARGGDVHVKASVTELAAGDLGRLVSLSAREGPHVMIETRDTGHGIDDAALGRIFDPFYTTKGPGRGLGLAAVIGIMHAHRGALSVTSTPGQGTTVRLFFPVAANEPAETTSGRTNESPVHGTVLVIDDERTVRIALARVLAGCGYEALVADSGREGLAIFKARLAGIRGVILDLTMPDMSGSQTFLELRRMRQDLPVLLVSGSNHSHELPDILRHERVRLLTKPFTSEALLEELAEALQ